MNPRKKNAAVGWACSALLLMTISPAHAQGIVFDFEGLPTGALPGGFLTLEKEGITALFSGNGTSISQDTVSGKNSLHTATFAGQIGMQFNVPVQSVTLSFAPSIPGPTHAMKIGFHYDANYSIVGLNRPTTRQATYTYIPGPNVWGLGLENVNEGFALTSFSIVPIPEPIFGTLFVLGAAVVAFTRIRKKSAL